MKYTWWDHTENWKDILALELKLGISSWWHQGWALSHWVMMSVLSWITLLYSEVVYFPSPTPSDGILLLCTVEWYERGFSWWQSRTIWWQLKIVDYDIILRLSHRCPCGRNRKLSCSNCTCNKICNSLKRGKFFVLKGPALELALIESPQYLPEAAGRPSWIDTESAQLLHSLSCSIPKK